MHPQAHTLQLPAAIETLKQELAMQECVALQAHVWRSLRQPHTTLTPASCASTATQPQVGAC